MVLLQSRQLSLPGKQAKRTISNPPCDMQQVTRRSAKAGYIFAGRRFTNSANRDDTSCPRLECITTTQADTKPLAILGQAFCKSCNPILVPPCSQGFKHRENAVKSSTTARVWVNLACGRRYPTCAG